MGRFWAKLAEGAKKVGRFIGNTAGVVGNVAGVLSNLPVIGGVASNVAKVANTVNKVANAGVGMIEQGQQIAKGPGSTMEKIVNTGKAVVKTADNLTGGAVSKGANQLINQGLQKAGVDRNQVVQSAKAIGSAVRAVANGPKIY